MPTSSVLGSLNEWDSAQAELTDPTADGPRAVINRAICDVYGSDDDAVRSIAGVVGGVAGSLALPSFCRPYWEDNGDVGPSEFSPVSGGQCDGVAYDVFVTRVPPGQSAEQTSEAYANSDLIGPCSVENIRADGPAGGDPQASIWKFDVVTAGDSFPGQIAARTSPTFEFVREDGMPDECGNPPGDVRPDPDYSNPRPSNSPTTVNVGGNDVDVVISDARVDVNGELYVEVTGPGFTVNVPVEGPGEIVPPSEPTEPVPDGSPVEPESPSGEVDDDLSGEDEEDGIETIGYRWLFPAVPDARGAIPLTTPKRFYPVLGSLQLRYQNADGLTFYGDVVRMQSEQGSLIRPDLRLTVTGVSYNSERIYGPLRLTPIRARRNKT